MTNPRPLTPHIMSCYTHKMAIVWRPQIAVTSLHHVYSLSAWWQWLQGTIQQSDALSSSTSEVLPAYRNVAHYRGNTVVVKFLPFESLTLTRDDLLDLKLVRYKQTCLDITTQNSVQDNFGFILYWYFLIKYIFCLLNEYFSSANVGNSWVFYAGAFSFF